MLNAVDLLIIDGQTSKSLSNLIAVFVDLFDII